METKTDECKICTSKTPNLICEMCDKWLELWEKRNDPDVAIINGSYYTIELKKYLDPGKLRVLIDFYDGRKVQTNNVLHHGKVPKMWARLGLTDTARWENA